MSTDSHQYTTCSDSYPPEIYEGGNLWDDQTKMVSSSTGNSQFLSTHNDDMELYYQIYSPKAGKSVDPRLIMLSENFRELFERKSELMFRKIFPRSDELEEFFKKIGEMVTREKSNQRGVRTMQRSMSFGSPRTREIKGGVSPLRAERFKVKTVTVNSDEQGGDDHTSGGGQGGTQPNGSK